MSLEKKKIRGIRVSLWIPKNKRYLKYKMDNQIKRGRSNFIDITYSSIILKALEEYYERNN